MTVFFIITTLVLALVFSLVKYQALQRQLFLAQSSIKNSNRKLEELQISATTFAVALQTLLSHRVNIGQRKASIGQNDIEIVKTLVQILPEVTRLVNENNENLETALQSLLKDSKPNYQEIQNFMQKQGSDVKLAWMKNNTCALSNTLVKLAELIDPWNS